MNIVERTHAVRCKTWSIIAQQKAAIGAAGGLLSKLTRRLTRPQRPGADWKLFLVRHVCPSIRLSRPLPSALFSGTHCSLICHRGGYLANPCSSFPLTIPRLHRQIIRTGNALAEILRYWYCPNSITSNLPKTCLKQGCKQVCSVTC